MSDAAVPPAAAPVPVTLRRIFIEFLIIGGTSFGGVVPYLRGGLVTRTGWLDDREFVGGPLEWTALADPFPAWDLDRDDD